MTIYRGITLIWNHCLQLISAISGWFSNLGWDDLISFYPLQFQPLITACLAIILGLSAVGLVKKLSFLLS